MHSDSGRIREITNVEDLITDGVTQGISELYNKKFIPADLSDTDLVVYGHSHKYEEKELNGVRYINPGSCGPRRFDQEITMAVMTVLDDGTFSIEKTVIPHIQ